MKDYHKKGGLKKGTALVLSACFLLGSGITSLAAGSGVTVAYEGLADTTSIKSTYDEDEVVAVDNIDSGIDEIDLQAKEIFTKAFDLDPDDVVMTDDGIVQHGLYGEDIINLAWLIPKKKTYMSTGFKVKEEDKVSTMVVGTPDDIEYEMGLKDPENIMWYVTGSDVTTQTFEIVLDGRHYFFVKNLSQEEDLYVQVSLIIPPDAPPEETE